MAILKNEPISENYPVLYIAHAFFSKGSKITNKFLLHFLIHDVLLLHGDEQFLK